MNFRARAWLVMLGAAGALLAAPARGDEVILRDGRKLIGTIVGFEKGVYRLETDFGTALIRKERIARIEFGAVEEKPAGGASMAPVPEKAPAPPPAVRERRPPGGRVIERVEGNTYVNDSFLFEMYKPPNWQVFDQAAREIPSAVTMLGTADQTTMLVVGTVLYDGPPGAYARVLENSLRQKYSEYAVQPEEHIRVAQRDAIRRSFSGMAGGQEWHGAVVNLADGVNHYGIIGVTRDEAFKFKEGVLAKIIASFRFR